MRLAALELHGDIAASRGGSAQRSIDCDLRGDSGFVGRVDRDDQAAFESQHAPPAGIIEGGAAAVGTAGQVKRSGNGDDRLADDHLHGVDHVSADVAEPTAAPLKRAGCELAEFSGRDEFAQPAVLRVKTAVVVNDQERARFLTRGEHSLGVGNGLGDGFFAEDRLCSRASRFDDHLGVLRCVGRDADDVEVLRGEHLAPVGVRLRAGPLFESRSASRVATGTADEVDLRVTRQRNEVGSVEVNDLLAEGIPGNLVRSADKAEPDDACFEFAHNSATRRSGGLRDVCSKSLSIRKRRFETQRPGEL